MFSESRLEPCFERQKELDLGDIGNLGPHRIFDLAAVRPFMLAKASNIEWL